MQQKRKIEHARQENMSIHGPSATWPTDKGKPTQSLAGLAGAVDMYGFLYALDAKFFDPHLPEVVSVLLRSLREDAKWMRLEDVDVLSRYDKILRELDAEIAVSDPTIVTPSPGRSIGPAPSVIKNP